MNTFLKSSSTGVAPDSNSLERKRRTTRAADGGESEAVEGLLQVEAGATPVLRWTRSRAVRRDGAVPITWVLAAMITAISIATACAGLKVGDVAPDLSQFKIEGKLPDTKGKVVLLDFWGSWCLPCAESFPVMEELHKRYGDRGFVVIAVSADEKSAAMQRFLKKHPVTFAVVRDAGQKLVAAADVQTMPTSFLIDAEGRVRFMHNGFHAEETKKQYVSEIESLLKNKP